MAGKERQRTILGFIKWGSDNLATICDDDLVLMKCDNGKILVA